MKKLLFVLLPLVLVTILSATHLTPADLKSDLDLSYGGDFVTRAIVHNDLYETDSGWFDNRLRLDLYAKLGDKFGLGWSPQFGYNSLYGYGTDSGIKHRELYMDYNLGMMDAKVRMGRQYWCDHRSLVLDDYIAGVTADMKIAGFDAEMGYLQGNDDPVGALGHSQVLFGNLSGNFDMFKFGGTLMYNQNHDVFDENDDYHVADIWLIPYFGVDMKPISADLTLVLDQQMFKDAANKDDSQLGIGLSAKGGIDIGVKVGADLLYITKEGLNTLSPYYENGLYLFGNKLPYDGVQIESGAFTSGEAYMSFVINGSLPLSDGFEVFGAVGAVTLKDPIGSELNVGANIKLAENIDFNPVLAIGQSGKHIDGKSAMGDGDENMVYMLGGLISAKF